VIVSAGRNARPWQGRVETPEPAQPPEYDANCYLCPGNERAHGVRNPRYASTFAFDNDFPALVPEPLAPIPDHSARQAELAPTDLLIARPERGICRVPAFAIRVVDRVGAGDAVLGIASPCAALNVPPQALGFIANVVGAEACTILGHRSFIEPTGLFRHITSLMK